MMAWEGTHSTLNHHTPHTLLQMLCSPFTLPNNSTLLTNSYLPPLALVSTPTPTPWPMVSTPTPSLCAPTLAPRTLWAYQHPESLVIFIILSQ